MFHSNVKQHYSQYITHNALHFAHPTTQWFCTTCQFDQTNRVSVFILILLWSRQVSCSGQFDFLFSIYRTLAMQMCYPKKPHYSLHNLSEPNRFCNILVSSVILEISLSLSLSLSLTLSHSISLEDCTHIANLMMVVLMWMNEWMSIVHCKRIEKINSACFLVCLV